MKLTQNSELDVFVDVEFESAVKIVISSSLEADASILYPLNRVINTSTTQCTIQCAANNCLLIIPRF